MSAFPLFILSHPSHIPDYVTHTYNLNSTVLGSDELIIYIRKQRFNSVRLSSP